MSESADQNRRRVPGDGSEQPESDPSSVANATLTTAASIDHLTIQSPSSADSSSSDSTTTTSGEAAAAIATVFRPNPELLNSIINLGFNPQLAEKALFYGSNDSLERAVNWLIDFGDQYDDGKPLSIEQKSSSSSGAANTIGSTTGGDSSMASSLLSPYKMVFVVNNALKMGVGKIAAQVGHATLGLYRDMLGNPEREAELVQWNEQGETKIVLRSDGGEEELMQLMNRAVSMKPAALRTYLVADAGRTQIASGSITVLSVFGPTDRVDEVTGKLKLLQ